MQPDVPRVVILGAGLTGLRAAVALLEKGYGVEVLEKLGEAGGMARSHRVGDFVFDHGPHGFFSRESWLVEEFKDVVGGEEAYHQLVKWSQIHYRGEYFNYPLRLADLASKMSPWTLLKALASFVRARGRLKLFPREPANAEEYLVDHFGQVLYNVFFGPYTRKVWAVDPRDLDADFTRDRVPTINLWDTIRKLFADPVKEQHRAAHTPSGRTPTHEIHRFYYPVSGAGALPRGYVNKITERRGRLRFHVQIEGIDWERSRIYGRCGEESFELNYEGLISTIPVRDLVPLLRPAPPREMAALAATFKSRATVLVNLCVRKQEVMGPFWIYYTDRLFNRISEYRHFSADLVPPGRTGICLEITCKQGDDLWRSEDAEIVQRCLPDLADLGLVSAEQIEDFLVIREANAYPVYHVGYREELRQVVDWLEGTAGIVSAGRQGRFLYINQDAALLEGCRAAQRLERLHTSRRLRASERAPSGSTARQSAVS